MSREFIKEVNTNLKKICKELGYKTGKYDFVLKINENVYHTISFDTTSHNGVVSVIPHVGIYYKDIDKLTSFLFDNLKDSYITPIAWVILGLLMPTHNFKTWYFYEGNDNKSGYKEILFNIQKYGIPFQKKMEAYENFFDAILQGRHTTGREYYLPAMYYLEGKKQLGLKTIEETIERKLKPRVLTDDEYESSIVTAKALKMPTDSISRIIKGYVNPAYLKFLERYKMLCNNEIEWENKYIESVDEAIELFVKHARMQSNSSQSGSYKTDNKSNDTVTTCITFLSRNNEQDRLSSFLDDKDVSLRLWSASALLDTRTKECKKVLKEIAKGNNNGILRLTAERALSEYEKKKSDKRHLFWKKIKSIILNKSHIF